MTLPPAAALGQRRQYTYAHFVSAVLSLRGGQEEDIRVYMYHDAPRPCQTTVGCVLL